MTKNSRSWAEPAEKAVADGINGNTTNQYAIKVAQAIQAHVPDIKEAKWKGASDYAEGGDIILYLNNGIVRMCETKFSKRTGSGTAKNLGAATFKKRINSSILGYQEFETVYREERYKLFEQYFGSRPKTASEYAKKVTAHFIANPEHPLKQQLNDITTPGQVKYAEYAASELNKFLPEVNNLVNWILGNIDSRQVNQDMIYCVVKNWEHEFQTVEFYDFLDMDRTVTQVEAKGKQVKFKNSKGKDVLTASVHWKNYIGVKTPCFNIFIGNEFKNND